MKSGLPNVLSPLRGSLRWRFSSVMGASGIVFGLLLAGFMEWRWEASIKSSAQHSLHLTAHEIARNLTQDLDSRQRDVILAAELVGATLISDQPSFQTLVDGLKRREPIYAWIGLTDPAGKVLAATDGLLVGQDVSARPWFAAGARNVFLGDPHEAKLLASHMKPGVDGGPPRFLDVAVPVRGPDQALKGVLGAHLYWDWVESVVKNALLDRDGGAPVEVLIADREGKWLLTPATEKSAGLPEFRRTEQSGQYLSAEAQMLTQTPAQGLGWTVIVRQQTQYALAPAYANRRLMLLFVVLGALAFAVATWYISAPVVRPIVDLARVARSHRSLREDAGGEATGETGDETGVLGQVMHQLAFFDALTGLANRRMLTERLTQTLQACAERHTLGAALLINLDNFSLLNDTKGHAAGDQLLVEVARRLQRITRPGDTLARTGSDEYVLVTGTLGPDGAQASTEALALAQRVLDVLRQPFSLDGGSHICQASIGIRLFGDEKISAVDVLKQANVALSDAKASGGNKAIAFDADMQTTLNQRALLESDLRNAIPQELVLLYQPQVDEHHEVQGAEALVRWQHPRLGMVSPHMFIPVAEDTGLIVPMGHWIMQEACRQLERWRADPRTRDLVLAINVSAREFGQDDFVEQVQKALDSTGADPKRLKLELTESVLAVDVDAVVRKMHALKALGVSFSLDDFGTGFASMTYLRQMPLDQLKIDQSFVKDVTTNANDASIVRTVIALGQSLGLQVIAEGVENQAQARFLAANGCRHFQGYLFGKPLPLEAFEAQLAS